MALVLCKITDSIELFFVIRIEECDFCWHLTAGVVGIKVVLWESCVSSSVFVAGNSCAGSKEGLQYHDQ